MASNAVDLGDFSFLRRQDRLLGEGGFGRVWLGERKTGPEEPTDPVAIKEVEKNLRTRKFVEREERLMMQLRRKPHTNVVRFFDLVKINSFVYFILGFCKLGDLNSFIRTQTEITFHFCLKCMESTAGGLRHLHKVIKICHRDIKPANVLVTGRPNSEEYDYQIADLGLARTMEESSSPAELTRHVGTSGWMAPEVPETANAPDSYSFPVDIFSLGLLFSSVFRYRPGGHLQAHEEGGVYLAAWLRTFESVGMRVKDLDLRFHGGRFVTQALTLIQRMVRFSTSDRCNIDQVCTEIQNIRGAVHDGPVTSDDTDIHVKAEAEVSRHVIVQKEKQTQSVTSPTGTSPGDAAGAVASSSAEASTVQAEGGVVSQMRELSIAGQPPHSTPGCDLELRKLGHITLPVTGTASLFFGQANLLVGFEKSPDLYYFEYQEDKYKLMWHKAIPQEVNYRCWKHMSPRGEFYLQSSRKEVCLYDQHLSLITTLSSPGGMISLLPCGEWALVDNCASPSTQTEGLRFAVTSVSNLHDIHHQLDVPTDGPYAREDVVVACGLEDGRLAVVVRTKPFCDLYDVSGHHTGRTTLPGGAGRPSCTSGYILVPLRHPPRLCVLDWAGHVTRILDHTELSLEKDDQCYGVSPVNNGLVSVWFGSPTKQQYLINTYQVL